MKATIFSKLAHKSHSGKTTTIETIIGTKENITDKVNDYIANRINKKNFIQVERFLVEIYNSQNNKVNSWSYIPTYR